MTFYRKNLIYLILLVILAAIAFVPRLKSKISDVFFPVAEIKNAISLSESDYDIDLKGINVPSTNLKTLKEEKPLFLNFWGTWCPPCREEWPTIQKLYDAQNGQLNFVLIAMQDQEETVREFLKKNNYTAPVYIAQSPLPEKLLPKVFPTTFILNKEGRILLKEEASKDWNSNSVHEFLKNSIK